MTARRYRVAAIPGDGIGPEVVGAARAVVDAAGEAFDFTVEWQELIVGGAAIDRYGTAIRDEDLAACRAADAVLLGAVGGPRWDDPGAAVRPEQALFAMRGGLGLYANLRPVTVDPALVDASPLRPERLAGGGPADPARADRRAVLRQAVGGARHAGRARGDRHARLHRGRDPPPGPPGVRDGARPPPPRHERGQGQRAGHVAPVAQGRGGDAGRLPGRDRGAPPGRRGGDAAHPAALSVRRHRHGEPLRRHPVGRGLGAGRLARHAALGLAGRPASRPWGASGSTSPSTARPPTSPARARPTRSAPSAPRRCCCAGRSARPTRRRRSRAPWPPRWPMGTARWTWDAPTTRTP